MTLLYYSWPTWPITPVPQGISAPFHTLLNQWTWSDHFCHCSVPLDIFLESLSSNHMTSLSTNQITSLISAHRSAGFLASLSSDQPKGDLIFDRVHYNPGSFYNPMTGVYTVPYSGYYLLAEQVNLTIPFSDCNSVSLNCLEKFDQCLGFLRGHQGIHPAWQSHLNILITVLDEVIRAPIELKCIFSYTILANPEVEPHAPNTYQSNLVPSNSINSNKHEWSISRW